MKKATFLATALLSASLISGRLNAQDTLAQRDIAAAQPAATNASASASSGTSLTHAASTSAVSTRAIKDLKTRFTNATNEEWSPMDKGFCAFFKLEGHPTRAYYDRKGHWLGSIRYVGEQQLPFFIRDIVKRSYYDLAITHVNIIEVPDHMAYLVHLEDKKTLKIVRVSDEGEMDVLNDFEKSN